MSDTREAAEAVMKQAQAAITLLGGREGRFQVNCHVADREPWLQYPCPECGVAFDKMPGLVCHGDFVHMECGWGDHKHRGGMTHAELERDYDDEPDDHPLDDSRVHLGERE